MVEFRADFLVDKETLYEDAADLCLDLDRFGKAPSGAKRSATEPLCADDGGFKFPDGFRPDTRGEYGYG